MNRLNFNRQSSTIGNIVIVSGLLATGMMLENSSDITTPSKPYELKINSSTFSNYGNKSLSENTGTISQNSFEQVVSGFYISLLESQETLGEDFEKVLYENLWDLYAR